MLASTSPPTLLRWCPSRLVGPPPFIGVPRRWIFPTGCSLGAFSVFGASDFPAPVAPPFLCLGPLLFPVGAPDFPPASVPKLGLAICGFGKPQIDPLAPASADGASPGGLLYPRGRPTPGPPGPPDWVLPSGLLCRRWRLALHRPAPRFAPPTVVWETLMAFIYRPCLLLELVPRLVVGPTVDSINHLALLAALVPPPRSYYPPCWRLTSPFFCPSPRWCPLFTAY